MGKIQNKKQRNFNCVRDPETGRFAPKSCERCRLYETCDVPAEKGDISKIGYSVCRFHKMGMMLNVRAAELFIRLNPREPVILTPRHLAQAYRWDKWAVNEPHLTHVDLDKPGIMIQIKSHYTKGKVIRMIIEGFHRAENHRRSRTP